MKERMWEWDDEENEYFSLRDKAKKEDVRYNPESVDGIGQGLLGVYYVWQEFRRDPYSWNDRDDESPYPSRPLLNIP